MESLKFSIIVPAYNAELYIGKCLDSLLQQDLSHADYEIIVIDDGSTDGTRHILDDYAKKESCVNVYTVVNQGVSEARNYGVRLAKGRYFLFVDSDDTMAANMLQYAYEKMELSGLDILLMDYSYHDDKDELKKEFDYVGKFSEGVGKVCLGRDFILKCLPPGMGNGLPYGLWRAHDFKFLPIRHEDEELISQVFYFAGRVELSDKVFYHYYKNPHSFMMNYDNRSCLYMIKAMQSLEAFRKARHMSEPYNSFFSDLISRRLLTAFRRGIKMGAPISVQYEMIEQMKTAKLTPVSSKKKAWHRVMFDKFPKLFVAYYRFKVKRR